MKPNVPYCSAIITMYNLSTICYYLSSSKQLFFKIKTPTKSPKSLKFFQNLTSEIHLTLLFLLSSAQSNGPTDFSV